MTCSSCKGRCPTPEACRLPIAQATKPPRFAFMLDDAFQRWPRGTAAVLLTFLLALWGFAGHLDQLADESIVLRGDTQEEQP